VPAGSSGDIDLSGSRDSELGDQLVIALVLLGFPIALLLAWALTHSRLRAKPKTA